MNEGKYLGETRVEQKDTPYKDFTKEDWALYFIANYGQIDGSHHKQWVLDQVARILKGSPILIELAKWENGCEEYRIYVGKPPKVYHEWVEELLGEKDEDGCYEYRYDEGVAP